MGIYRQVQMSFWTDTKIEDEFTPEDKYFYLYLLTNPHSNLCGCYEISLKQMSDDTGYTKEMIQKLLKRFSDVHNIVKYSYETKEVLLLNWSKYNWTSSAKFLQGLDKEIKLIKNDLFKKYVVSLRMGENLEFNDLEKEKDGYGMDRVSDNEVYPMDTTVCLLSVSDTVTDNVLLNNKKDKEIKNNILADDECKTVIEKWNGDGNHPVEHLTPERKQQLESLKKQYGLPKIIKAIGKIKDSDYLQGKVNGFVINFDWFMDNLVQVLEGNYDNHSTPAPKPKSKFGYEAQSDTYKNFDEDEFEKSILGN